MFCGLALHLGVCGRVVEGDVEDDFFREAARFGPVSSLQITREVIAGAGDLAPPLEVPHAGDLGQPGEPAHLAKDPLTPASAQWIALDDSHLAILRYDAARTETDPRAAVLTCYENAYRAGAVRAGWDVSRLACSGGVTDPRLPAPPL